MSYSILYRKAFLKLSDGTFIPIDESGDNNCWDGNKRARSWSNGWSMFKDKLSFSQVEIKEKVQSLINRYINEYAYADLSYTTRKYTAKEVQDDLGNFMSMCISGKGNHMSAQDLMNWFMKGCENAVSVEKMASVTNIYLLATRNGQTTEYKVQGEAELRTLYGNCISNGVSITLTYRYLNDWEYSMLYPKVSVHRQNIVHDKAFLVQVADGRYVYKSSRTDCSHE